MWALITLILALGFILKTLLEAAIWFFKDWWTDRKEIKQRQSQALLENTMAIVELRIQVKQLNDFLMIIPKLKADVDLAHDKIRSMSKN